MLIGDLPIFVAHDSADVWAHPERITSMSAASRGTWPVYRRIISARPASSGETRSIAGRSTPRAAMPGGFPGSAPAQPGGPDPDRSFPRLRGLLGDPCRVGDRGDGSMGPGTWARLLQDDSYGSWAWSRSSPRISG